MWQWRQRSFFMCLGIMLVLAVFMVGCSENSDGDEGFEGVETQDMANRTFIFPDGRAFDLESQQVTLDVDVFGAAGNDNAALVTLSNAAGTADGEIRVDEEGSIIGGINQEDAQCIITITDSSIAELAVGQIINLVPCEVNDADGSLRVENEDTDEISTSEAP